MRYEQYTFIIENLENVKNRRKICVSHLSGRNNLLIYLFSKQNWDNTI